MPAERRGRRDTGAGLVGTLSGVTAFLALMLLSVQLLTNLSARSVVTGAAHEGARLVATRGVEHHDPVASAAGRAAADRRVRTLLGPLADRATLDWAGTTSDVVVLRVRTEAPGVLGGGLRHHLGARTIERTARVRVESFR